MDNGDSTYENTFNRNIMKTKAVLDAYKYNAGKNETKADLGDATYAPTLTHRLTIQFSGDARGTGSNTSDGVTLATAGTMEKPGNLLYGFISVTGKPVTEKNTQREVVAVQNCHSCHTGSHPSTAAPGSRLRTVSCSTPTSAPLTVPYDGHRVIVTSLKKSLNSGLSRRERRMRNGLGMGKE
jgi:hypothetical protein